MYAQIFLEEIYMFENNKLLMSDGQHDRQQLGRFGEYYAKMVLASNGFAIYTSEVDDHGIDFVAEKGNEFLKFQVKTVRLQKAKNSGNGYVFMKKEKFDVNDDNLFLILVVIIIDDKDKDSFSPDIYIIPASEWKNPQPPLVYRSYEKKKSNPEYGINLSLRRIRNEKEQNAQIEPKGLSKYLLKNSTVVMNI